jgi:hypothetical protein
VCKECGDRGGEEDKVVVDHEVGVDVMGDIDKKRDDGGECVDVDDVDDTDEERDVGTEYVGIATGYERGDVTEEVDMLRGVRYLSILICSRNIALYFEDVRRPAYRNSNRNARL